MLSVVVPVFNEEQSLAMLHQELSEVASAQGYDLDLVFVYGDPETAPAPGSMSETEYFAQVASLTVKRLKEPTRHGVLYDADARLRPDGGKGKVAQDHGPLL